MIGQTIKCIVRSIIASSQINSLNLHDLTGQTISPYKILEKIGGAWRRLQSPGHQARLAVGLNPLPAKLSQSEEQKMRLYMKPRQRRRSHASGRVTGAVLKRSLCCFCLMLSYENFSNFQRERIVP